MPTDIVLLVKYQNVQKFNITKKGKPQKNFMALE